MKNNSLLLLKVAVAAVLMFGLFSCSTSHKGCAGICSNKGKPMGKYMGLAKNSKPSTW